MSRINTNVSSLVAQNTLARSNADLQTSLSRLSTGLRINVGKDDPAGLIASESLRRDITSLNKAVTNTERANQLIATADSALGQVSALLNDIRGLVTEAANIGAQSEEQIAANQLQVDSSLEAIDRIAQTTTFQGRKLLDGSLAFLTSGGSGFSTVSDLSIDQATLGSTGQVAVAIDITSAATQAQITNSVPTSAATQFTLDSRTFTVTASDASTATVDLKINANNNNTGTATFDGHTFRLTSSLAQATAISVDTTNADNLADGSLTIDSTVFALAADTGETFDNVDVVVQKSALGATADTDALISIGDDTPGGENVQFNLAVDSAGLNATLVNADNITVAVDDTQNIATLGADVTANYDTGSSTLTISIGSDAVAITAAEVEAAVEAATVNTVSTGADTFILSGIVDNGPFSVAGGASTVTSGIGANTLTREEATAAFNATTDVLTITLNSDLATVAATDVEAAIGAIATTPFAAVTHTGGSNITTASVAASTTHTDLVTRDGVKVGYAANTLTLTFDNADTAVDFNEIKAAVEAETEIDLFEFVSATSGSIDGTTQTPSTTRGTLNRIDGAAADFDSTSSKLTLTFDGSDAAVTAAEIETAIEAITGGTTFAVTETGTGTIDATALSDTTGFSTIGQVQDLLIQVAGAIGAEVFSFQAGTTFQQIADAISLVSDGIGVSAQVNGGQLEITSTTYGDDGTIDIEVINEGAGGTFETNLSATRATGTNIAARVNGIQANGDGNTLSINTSTLDLALTVADGSSTDVNFTITGGGAIFQLGPNVVSNQQASIGIDSIATGTLGGAAGRLFEIRSGATSSLSNNPGSAANIVDEVITKVTSLRGRLGAFQRTTLESNLISLNDTIANLTEAQSSIRDADFARESANLTRAQILVQSGTSVLAIANQNPQNVLSLLR